MIVCGGGLAGVAAAVSVANNGLSVLLEKSNILGGLGTLGLINMFVPMCNGWGKQIILGLAEKWLRISAELSLDSIPPEMEKRTACRTNWKRKM